MTASSPRSLGRLDKNKIPGTDSRERKGQDIRGTEKDVARAYNDHFFGDKPTAVGRRTSMIIDPPDGRLPSYTPEAQARIAAKREYLAALLQGTGGGKPGPISPRRNEPSPDYNIDRLNRTDGPEDRSGPERCMEYKCVELVEETFLGHLRKTQLVKHWEGDTIAIDITRKVPPGEKMYQR